jgi:hypothetical protein
MDPFYKKIKEQLQSLEEKYGKSLDEVTDGFIRVSGQLDKLSQLLEGKNVVEWSFLEDLALQKS